MKEHPILSDHCKELKIPFARQSLVLLAHMSNVLWLVMGWVELWRVGVLWTQNKS